MSLINVTDLTFAYEGSYDTIFEGVCFALDTNWRLGFTGRNGRGKTTFLRLLMGELEYRGSITASVQFEYFPYAVHDPEQLTEAVLEQTGEDWQRWELVRELALLEVPEEVLYRPFCTLSNGERTKVLLAAMFLRRNSFLLIDEPTNHLDLEGRRLLARYLCRKSGFILVSHDRRFLDECTDHTLSINRTNIEVCKGSFSTWWENKQQRDNWELEENERLRGDIRRLNESARRTADWSDKVEKTKHATRNSGLRPDRGFIGHKAAKMMQRAKNTERRKLDAIEHKSALLHNVEETESLRLQPMDYPKRRLAELRGLTVCYEERKICSATFSVERRERIALCGGNGSGKSSILRLLMGESVPYTGCLELGSGLVISYVPQDTSFLQGGLEDFARNRQLDDSLFRAILRKLDFSRVQFEKRMEDYSAGQKKKVLLAASLCTRAHLYIWDEPLNYVDVFSRMQLETLLEGCGATLLLVEHDADFIEKIATKRIDLNS